MKWLHNVLGGKGSQEAITLVKQGLYEIKDESAVSLHFLENAVPLEYADDSLEADALPRYAWLRGGLAAPGSQDFYILKFEEGNQFSILAYADSYQRMFQCSEAQEIPPAKWPKLEFERTQASGAVQLHDDSGTSVAVADFNCQEGAFSLEGSWYDFGSFGQGVCREEAMARAYLAFVHRPTVFGSKRPLRGIGMVEDMLRKHQVLESLNRIVSVVQAAQSDVAQKPPALLVLFMRMLQEAGLASALATERNTGYSQVRLMNPAQSNALCYLAAEDGCAVTERAIWQIEGALNHFFILKEMLGPRAASASAQECQDLSDSLLCAVIRQAADAELPRDAHAPVFAKDWDIRVGIARELESYRLPYRFAAEFDCNPDAGKVSYKIVAPDAFMMPQHALEGDQLRKLSLEERVQLSVSYAMRIGVLVAAAAFYQSQGIEKVSVEVSYFYNQGASQDENGGDPTQGGKDFNVTFSRNQFKDRQEYVAQVEQDAYPFYQQAGWVMGQEGDGPWGIEELAVLEISSSNQGDPVSAIGGLMAEKDRVLKTDVLDQPMGMVSSMSLGCRSTRNMRINYDAGQKHRAQVIAEQLSQSPNLQEGIKVLRAMQEETDDPKVFASCNRVMEKLALGEVDMRSQADIVSLFVGDDPYLDALTRSRAISMNPDAPIDEAIAILKKIVDEAEHAGVFADDDSLVYRVFDSSAARVIYNLSREGIIRSTGLDLQEDKGKAVELAPDSYLFCNLELVRLLEHTFDRTEDALAYGHIALRLAPTMVVGYRTLARVYMLMGDLSSARDLLCQALRFAVHPMDVGLLYYQLGYVEWKAGRLRAAIACYLRAIGESPQIRNQVSSELRELLGEEGARMMDVSQVMPTLRSSQIPLAPSGELLNCLSAAAEAAVNEGLYPAARNMLSLQLHHQPDDVLSHVLRSLG